MAPDDRRSITQRTLDLLKEEWTKPGAELADALDRFYNDLRYTAPEQIGQRLNELGARIAGPMATFGYPRRTEGAR